MIGESIVTSPVAIPSESGYVALRNLNDQMIVDPSFLGQSEVPTYRRLRWISDNKLQGFATATSASGEIQLPAVPPRERWRITRVVWGCSSTGRSATMYLHAGSSAYGAGLVDQDVVSAGTTGSQVPGIFIDTDAKNLIGAGSMLRVFYTGVLAGDILSIAVYVDVYILENAVGRPGGGANEPMD